MAAQENNLRVLCAFGKVGVVRAALQAGGDPNTRGWKFQQDLFDVGNIQQPGGGGGRAAGTT